MSMFDNYKSKDSVGLPPDNMSEQLPVKEDFADTLIIGRSAMHIYSVPHLAEEIKYIKIIYTQGIETILTYIWEQQDNEHVECIDAGDEENQEATFSVYIPSNEVFCFNSYNKDVKAQVHCMLKDGTTDVSEIYRLRVLPMVKCNILEDEDE